MSRWKAVERRVAKALGGERVPITGRQRGNVPDVKHDRLGIEVKDRAKLPAWLHDAVDQADAVVRTGGGKIACAVLREKGQRIEDSYCVLRLRDVRALVAS